MSISKEQVKTALENLGVSVSDFDGQDYAKFNSLLKAIYDTGDIEDDYIIDLDVFTDRLNADGNS